MLLVLWYLRQQDIVAYFAYNGWSPIHFANNLLRPENFLQDFPNVSIYKNSLTMWFYPLADYLFGVEAATMLKMYIFFDYLLTAAALVFLARSILPEFNSLRLFVFVMLVVASLARTAETANNGTPVFVGLYYHTAEAFQFIAIGMCLRRRYVTAWLFAALSFTTHVVYGTGTCLWIVAVVLYDWRKSLTASQIFGMTVAGLVMGFWLFGVIGFGLTERPLVPTATWFTLSKMMQFDFYPFTRGLFTTHHHQQLFPFLGLIVIGFAAMRTPWLVDNDRMQRILVGQLVVLGVTVVGLSLSEQTFSTLAIRLNLQRIDLIFVTVALVFVVDFLCRSIENGPWWRRVVGSIVLFMPFLNQKPAFPVLLMLLLCIPTVYTVLSRDQKRTPPGLLLLASFGLVLVLLSIYSLRGYVNLSVFASYWGNRDLILPFVIFLAGSTLAVYLLRGRLPSAKIWALGIGFAVTIGAIHFQLDRSISGERRVMFDNYLKTQIWARHNTPTNALFMVDPTIYYGWSDFSCRSSFGNIRDWLMASWLYTMDRTIYQEGLRRFSAFGIDLEPYINEKPSIKDFRRLSKDVRKRFYQWDDKTRKELAKRFDIHYFVLRKRYIRHEPKLLPVYENEHFAIYSTESPPFSTNWRHLIVGSLAGKMTAHIEISEWKGSWANVIPHHLRSSWPITLRTDGRTYPGPWRHSRSMEVTGISRISSSIPFFASHEGAVSFWVYKPIPAGDEGFSLTLNTDLDQISVTIGGTGNIALELNTHIMVNKAVPLVPAKWHHIVLSWQMKSAHLYMDGVPIFEAGLNRPVNLEKAEIEIAPQTAVDSNESNIRWAGFSMFSRATTAEEVKAFFEYHKTQPLDRDWARQLPKVIPDDWYILGRNALHWQADAIAADCFGRLIKLAPDPMDGLAGLAIALCNLEQVEAARRIFPSDWEKKIENAKTDARAIIYADIGYALNLMNQLIDSQRAFDLAISEGGLVWERLFPKQKAQLKFWLLQRTSRYVIFEWPTKQLSRVFRTDSETKLKWTDLPLRLNRGAIAFWARLDNDSQTLAFLCRANNQGVHIYRKQQDRRLYVRYNNAWIGKSVRKIPLHQWFHVVFTWEDKNQAVYIDGKLEMQAENVATSQEVRFLSLGWANTSASSAWLGAMAAVKIFDRPLSSLEVMAIMNSAPN